MDIEKAAINTSLKGLSLRAMLKMKLNRISTGNCHLLKGTILVCQKTSKIVMKKGVLEIGA